jgi:LPPG:FO 2-phospho-L-lactate transferase
VLAICGGVGGAKLALGLDRVLPPGELALVVNTGDDFVHLGLHVSPDLDTVMYTLAGVVSRSQGWGREGDTRRFLDELGRLGGPTWFQIGDLDLAVHAERTRRLAAGESLTVATAALAASFGLQRPLLPMSDDPVRTIVDTEQGVLEFQEYFVRHRCEPRVRAIRFAGADVARASPAVLALLASPGLEAVLVCPSNPWLSIDPILAVPGLRRALAGCRAPVVAVSPVVAGRAIKGPTAKLMAELGLEVSAVGVASHYAGLIDGFVLDELDAALAGRLGLPSVAVPTVMRSLEDREALARAALGFARRLPGGPRLRQAS